MNDKQSLHFDWLSDVLKTDLLISEKDLIADVHKSEHSFLRNLLSDTAMNDDYEGIQRSDTDLFDNKTVSANLSHIAVNLPTVLTEHSSLQVVCAESEMVVKPPGLVEKGSKSGRLRCQISRTNSVSDRSFADDSTDNLLKTPAGFYDRSCALSSLSIPPLFDYSYGLFTNPCHSDASCSLSSTGNSPLCSILEDENLCSILEDEKWSEGSEVSVDIDASSMSALSPADFTEDGMLSISDDEDKLSKQEECVVLSVVQNVLSDEAISLSFDESVKDKGCCDERPQSPDIQSPSSENSAVVESCHLPRSSTTDTSRLNPLARPFSCVPKIPLQPMRVVFTPSMPTIVVPVKIAYTKLVPVATSKSPSSKRPEKSVHRNNTMILSSNTANGK